MKKISKKIISTLFVVFCFLVTIKGTAATVYFNQIYKATGTTYGVESNSLDNLQLVTGYSFKIISEIPGAATFSGNNIRVILNYVNSSGTELSMYGIISRRTKSGSTTLGVNFIPTDSTWSTETGDGYFLVNPGQETSFSNGANAGTSSDPIDTTLNNMLSFQAAAPIINSSVSSVSVLENAGYAVFTFSLSNTATSSYSFTPNLTAVTAVSGTDYSNSIEYYNGSSWLSASGGVTFSTAFTLFQLRVPIINYNTSLTDKTFNINTGPISGGGILNNYGSYGVGTIVVPVITSSGSLTAFSTCAGVVSPEQSFTVSGINLVGNLVVTPPEGYEVSTTSGSGFGSSVSLTPASNSVASTTIYVRLSTIAANNADGNIVCSSTSAVSKNVATVASTVIALPTITLDYIDDVPVTATSFSIPYTALAGSPDKYSLTTASNSVTSVAMAGFTPITNATITSSPILVTIPASAAAEYGFNLTVTNSSTGCSNVYPFQFHVTSINHGTIGSNQTICSGATPATLTTVTPGSATNGATITYTWENSSTSLLTGYTTISGATEENYSPGILTQTTYFKRVAHATIGGVDVTADSDPVTITVTPVAESGSISGTSTVCTTTNSAILTLEGTVGNVSKWQYSSDNFESDSHDVSNTTTTLTATNLLATTYYRALVASGSCSTATSTSFEIVVLSSNIWTGTTSTAWSIATNWSCGVPLSGDSIEIPGGLTNYPVLDGSKTIGNVILADGATINLNNAALSVSGTFSGTGTLIGGNTSSLAINGSGPKGTFYMDQTTPGTTNVLDNFTLNTTTGSATLGNALDISGILTLTNGTLSTGGNLTLKSSSTKTAVVAEITDCNAVAITGDVTVEQYFPLGRAFRFISSPVTTSTSIRDNWQEGVNNTPPAYTNNFNPHPGYGTHITGTIVGSNGFDATQTTNNSMFTYNNTSGAWATVPNTNALTLTAGEPYRLLIRGDRSINMSSNDPIATNTTLRAKGILKICDAPAVTLNQNADGLSFIGNPYQAVVDIKKVLIQSNNFVANYYYVWDPKINSRGTYVIYDLLGEINPIINSKVNKYLQPWQACFVKNKNSGGGSITFQETDKVTDTKRNIYKTNSQTNSVSYIRLTLYESNTLAANGTAADGLIVKFGNDYNNAIDENDAAKFSNLDETFSTKNNSTLLGIESRSFPATSEPETIPLNITNYRSTNYTLVANGTNISGLTAYLHDQLLQTYTAIPPSDSVKYSFVINANDATTSASDRFKIVLQNKNLDLQTTTAVAFTMYPNPSLQGVFDVLMNEVPKDTKLTIYNEIGQEVYTTNLTQSSTNHINPNKALAKGVYYVKIKNNTTTTVNKLIIE